jgi:hypothetical protein
VTLGNRLADMPIVENRPANVLTRSDLLFRSHMAPGAPSSITEFLRQETRELRSSPQKRIITVSTRASFIDHNSQRFDGSIDHSRRRASRSTHLDPVDAWQRAIEVQPSQSIDCVEHAGQDHRLTVVFVLSHGPNV